jgi:hypothetical protein
VYKEKHQVRIAVYCAVPAMGSFSAEHVGRYSTQLPRLLSYEPPMLVSFVLLYSRKRVFHRLRKTSKLDVTTATLNDRNDSFPMISWKPELGWTLSQLLPRDPILYRHSQTNSPAVKSIFRGDIGSKRSDGGLYVFQGTSGLFLCVFRGAIGGVENSMAKLFNNGK